MTKFNHLHKPSDPDEAMTARSIRPPFHVGSDCISLIRIFGARQVAKDVPVSSMSIFTDSGSAQLDCEFRRSQRAISGNSIDCFPALQSTGEHVGDVAGSEVVGHVE